MTGSASSASVLVGLQLWDSFVVVVVAFAAVVVVAVHRLQVCWWALQLSDSFAVDVVVADFVAVVVVVAVHRLQVGWWACSCRTTVWLSFVVVVVAFAVVVVVVVVVSVGYNYNPIVLFAVFMYALYS